MKKRVLSMLMTLALCLTLLPTPAWAAEDAPEGGVIVQQEQQEEISPAVSEQAGTNEEENGSEGDPQNTGTPDAGGAEDSKADAPENGEDENAGNNADAAVSAVQTMIDALPTVSELDGMTAGELDAAYNDIQAAYDAYEALNAEQQAQITGADFEALLGWFNSQTAPLADAKSGVHTHCVCGKDSSTTVNGHTHNTGTTWTATNALPSTAGSYYLTQSVSENWTVPTDGEVTLCLNGQTINGKITVGDGATLTLTDCSGNGKVQGEVTVNGGKFELYSGTITGGVQVGMKGGSYNTGSAFTMYGGAITGNEDYGGVFLVGTTNHIDPPSFTMHGGTISDNTAGASDGGGGGVYVGEKCSFTMDGGTITGNTATAGNGGGIYIHFNAGTVSISNATITGNKASATGDTRYGHGGGIYSERGVTVKNVTITGNNSTFEGGGIYGKGAITLTDATVTDNSQYDVYYDGRESNTPELTISGSVKAGYYANYDWKLPILVSGALSEDSVIRVGVREGINPGAIAEPASGVTLSAENFKADAADSVTSLGNDGKVYLVPCTHEMDDTGYTCKKCHTQFDARVGDSAYYQTLTKAFDAARGSTVTLLRDVTLTGNCSSDTYSATLDLNGKTVSTENKYIHVGGGNKSNTLTVKDSSKGGGTQALNVKFSVGSNGTLAVDDSYTGEISRVELQAGGALERFGGKIGELVLSNAAYGSTSTGYGLKLWKGNPNACTIGKITDNTKSKSLTVNDLLGTDYAKCELYGEKDDAWSIVPKTEKISELTGYTAYKVQFTECVHQCADDSNPVCSVCHKDLYTKITAKAADGTTKTAYFTEDSALENGYVEAIQTLNGWSNEGCTEPTLTLLRDMPYGTSITLTGTLTLEGGTHTASNVTVAENANVTFASGSYSGATINGTATVETGVTFTAASVTVNGTLNAKGGIFNGPVKFNGSSTANISGGSFNCEKKYGGVEFGYNVTGTISGGMFAFADFYTTKVKLSGGTFTIIKTNGDRKLADLLAEGAAYYGASDNQAVTNDSVNTLENVKVVSHTHNGGTDGKGICSICGKQMAASLTVGDKTSWYAAFATAIEAANAADGEKTITLYQDVNGYADGHSTTYELTRGPVTLATGGKTVTRVNLIAKGISLTVTGSNGGFYVTVDGKDAELTVNDKDTKLAIVTAKNGGKLSLSNGTFSRVDVMNDGSSASLSGGSYGEITSGNDYVKPYALLAKGYAYKKEDNTWVSNANIGLSKVTVEKAPFAVEKIYPNRDTNYTGNSAFATDGNITLTAVIAPETQGVTYYYWWELFDESDNDWTTHFGDVNTATHTGEKSKTLTISGLPTDKSYQYHIFVQCSNGYQCYSEPFTVTQHQHSWTYTASGATITAKCTAEGCYLTDGNGGSVTIAAPTELTYSGEGKPATVTASSDWQGPAASGITISYIKTGKYGPEKLENDALPTKAGTYTASITLGEGNKAATASVTYTIGKATPKAEDFTFTAPTSLTYDGNVKSATVSPADDVIVKYYDKDGKEATPKNAGEYTVKIDVAESTNYAAANGLTADGWKFSITKAAAPAAETGSLTIVNGHEKTYTVTLPALPTLETPKEYGTLTYEIGEIKLNDGYYTGGAKVENGELTLPIQKNDVETTGSVGTVTVVIKSTNYEDITLTVNVSAANKIEPTPDGEITATSITYGDTLSKSNISGKMKDPTTDDAVKGTFAWKDDTIKPAANDSYVAEWTFTPDAPEYATVTGKATVKVAPKSIEGATITLKKREFTYNAAEQSPTITGVTLKGWSDTITYHIVNGDKATNANDSITLTIKGSGNYTGTATAEWKIIPAKLTVSVPSEVKKEYDGTTNATVTPTFNGLRGKDNLTAADYSVTAAFDNAKVGYKKTVIGKVTLNQTETAKNYVLTNDGNFSTDDGTIAKAAAPTVQPVELTIYNGVQADYYVDLPSLPDLGKGKSYGTVGYRKTHTINLSEGYKAQSDLRADPENLNTLRLLLHMTQTGSLTGEIGTVTIPVTTSNYQDINLTVNVSAVNQIKPKPVGTITATPITYGNELSMSTITGTMQDPATGDAVNGTFTWVTPDEKLKASNHNAEWTFTPDKSYGGKYTTNTGTATVTVNPKAVTVSGITANDKVYDGNANAVLDYSAVTLGGVLENDTLTVTAKGMFEKADVGEQKVKISELTLGGGSAANYVLAENGNQTETTANITAREVTVTITPNGGTYGSVTAATAKLSGAVDGENIPVTLTYTGNGYNSTDVPTNAGSYTVTASIADSNYVPTGETTANFVIEPKSIKGATVKLGKGLTANGAEQTQTVAKVLLGDKEIPADSYTVSGNTATAHGIYTLTVTGKGNYKDFVKWTYVIAPAKAEDAPGEDITIGSGKVKVDVQSEGTVPPATLLTDKAELLAMLVNSGDITADELVQIANGANVDIVLTVKEANDPGAVKTAMAQAAKDYTIGQYLDISLFKYMTVNGSQQAGVPLHTTKDALTISVVVPDALINTNSAVNRTYCIVRNHEGTITVLDAAFDAAGKTLTFKTDRFSIYAIAYKDTAVPSSGSNPGSNNSSNDSETKKNEVAAPTPAPTPASTSKPSTITAMPQTGDTSNPTLYVVLLVASLLGLAVVFVCKKRNDK